MITKIITGIIALGLAVAGFVFPVQQPPQAPEITRSELEGLGDYVLRLGATIPTPVASFSTSLAAKITSSDTSMTLVSITTDDSTTLTNGTVYGFVIDANTASEEFVLGTASSTSIVSMTRGISVITGNTNVAALQKEHRRGSSVKITDAPVLLVMARILNGDETIPNVLTYASGVSTSTIAADGSNLVSVDLLNDTSITGAVNATTAVKGIIELATAAETASSTATGGTGASLVPPASLFGTTAAASKVLMAESDGKIQQGWLDLTEAWTFTGDVRTASTTISGALTVSATSTFSGAVTFSSNITIPGTPTASTHAASKGYVDSLMDFSTSTDLSTTWTDGTSTLGLTLAHDATDTVVTICTGGTTTNNETGALYLRTAPGGSNLDDCSAGSGTGEGGECTLMLIQVPGGTSTSYYVNNAGLANASGGCIAFTLD